MTAITTYKFKKNLADSLYSDIFSRRAKYYTFFAKSVDALTNTIEYESKLRQSIISAKRIFSQDIAYIVPRFDWTSGTTYTKYNVLLNGTVQASGPKFYVYESANHRVYKCLENGFNNPSTVMPTGTSPDPVTYNDGYIWQYMYTIPKTYRQKFLTGDFIPVFSSLDTRFFQDGAIEDITIISSGYGYTQFTTKIEVIGDGSGAELHPVIKDGKLADIIIKNPGTGYTRAKASITDTTGLGADISINLYSGDIESDQAITELLSVNGTIDSIEVLTPGADYLTATIQIKGDGTGASAQAELVAGQISRIVVTNRGTGYTRATVEITGQVLPYAPSMAATARANVSPYLGHARNAVDDLFATRLCIFTNIYSDKISDQSVLTNYDRYGLAKNFRNYDYSTFVYDQLTSSHYVVKADFSVYQKVLGGNGSGAKLKVNTTGQYVQKVYIENAGENYTSAPTVSFSSVGETVAPAANAIISGGVDSATINNPGIGYLSNPMLSVQSATGASALIMTSTGMAVSQIIINNAGTGYSSAPTISITGGGGSGATAIGYVSQGKLVKVKITNPGTGFTSPPLVTVTGGGASVDAVCSALVQQTSVGSVSVQNSGNAYQTPPTVTAIGGCGIKDIEILDSGENFYPGITATVQGGGGSGATVELSIEECLRSIIVTNQGSGFTSAPTVSITGGGGAGATATAVISGDKLVAVNITNRGYGYTSAPTIGFTGGDGVGAAASSVVGYGINHVHITHPGYGYTSSPSLVFSGTGRRGFQQNIVLAKAEISAGIKGTLKSIVITNSGSGVQTTPTVSLTGGGGTGASAYAEVLGHVSSVDVISGGFGYTETPTVQIISPWGGSGAEALASIDATTGAVTAVTVVADGRDYQISEFADFRLGDTIVDESKNEFTITSANISKEGNVLILRSNAGYPITANQVLRKKNSSFKFTTDYANGRQLVESRFAVAAYKVTCEFLSGAGEADFIVGDIITKTDTVNGNKTYQILDKKTLLGISTVELLLKSLDGGKLNMNDTLINLQTGKQFTISDYSKPDIDVHTGDVLVVSSADTFIQNADQSIQIRTILQF